MKKIVMSLLVILGSGLLPAQADIIAETAKDKAGGLPELSLKGSYVVGGPGGWDLLSYDAAHKRLYVAHSSSAAVLDLSTGKAEARLTEAEGAHVVLPVKAGSEVLITHGKANKVTFNDARTGAVLASLATGTKPDAAILDPFTGLVAVMNNGGTSVDIVDPASHGRVASVEVGGAPELAATDGKGRVFTHLEDKDALAVIDMVHHVKRAVFALVDCHEPSGLAYIAGRDWLLSACHNGLARLTNATTGAEIATFPIGPGPDGAAYDEVRKRAYVPTSDSRLSVIDFNTLTPRLMGTVRGAPGGRQIALDATSGLIFLPTAQFGPPEHPGGRPSIVPDSFSILVLSQ